MFDKGVRYVYDLVDENGSIFFNAEFCSKFDFYPAFTLYYGIIQRIRGSIDMIDINRLISDHPYRPKYIEVLVNDINVLDIRGSSVKYEDTVNTEAKTSNNMELFLFV